MHMRIAIAGDHNGVALKARLVAFLTTRGHKLDDRGTHDPEVVVDYPRLCEDVCRQVVDGQVDRGIMIGGTGSGEQIACNKIRGVRAGLWLATAFKGDRHQRRLDQIAALERGESLL